MAVTISPLDLRLDTENPRFVILSSREQADIRKYLVTYEDVCQLATAINEYGSLLPGERIVVLMENNHYTVVEGNRRTCSLQLLLSRDLIPDGFAHRIPRTSEKILENCGSIEVDVLPDRNAALELMSKRHIEGVKQWKPLAKKQFFAANYKNGHGQSVYDLSKITGIREGEIKEDIRDYKFFFYVYEKYCERHPDFNKEIIVLKTDPFWRIFKAKFEYPVGEKISPKDLFDITYDDTLNTICGVDRDLFDQVALLVFEKAIVQETITTRNVLTDIEEIRPLLQAIIEKKTATSPVSVENTTADGSETQLPPADDSGSHPPQSGNGGSTLPQSGTPNPGTIRSDAGENRGSSGGPRPGGPPPRTFFETLSWHGKLDPANRDHQGLLCAVNELYGLSNTNCGRQKAYKSFPVATGMVLRSVYEQALRLRLIQIGLWGAYCKTLSGKFPALKSMEDFINLGANKTIVFPEQGMIIVFDRVIAATHRDFLNANIHYPGNINVTADSLESIAAGGMFALIQGIIDLIN